MIGPRFKDSASATTLSVCLVTYNSAEVIEACLNSILPQITPLNGEVVVVDNASTDSTWELLQQYAAREPVIRVIRNSTNLGYSAAMNQAWRSSGGQFVFLLNPDTQVTPGAIKTLLETLQGDLELAAVAPQLRFPDGRIQYSCRRFPRRRDVFYELLGLTRLFPRSRFFNYWKMGDFDHLHPRPVPQPAGAALLIRRRDLIRAGGLDEAFPMFFSDVMLCRRLWQAGRKILFQPTAVVIHFGGHAVRRNPHVLRLSHEAFALYFRRIYPHAYQLPANLIVSGWLKVAWWIRSLGIRLWGSRRRLNKELL